MFAATFAWLGTAIEHGGEFDKPPYERVLGWMIIIGQSGQATIPEVMLSSSSSDGTFTDLLAT